MNFRETMLFSKSHIIRLYPLLVIVWVFTLPLLYLSTYEYEEKNLIHQEPTNVEIGDTFKFNGSYPLDINFTDFIQKTKKGEKITFKKVFRYELPVSLEPEISKLSRKPNKNHLLSSLNNDNEVKSVDILMMIKSKGSNFVLREIVRATWGDETLFPRNFRVRKFFVVGNSHRESFRRKLVKEFNKYEDIIQFDYVESYFFNLYKTMNTIRWVVKNKWRARFVLFIDDDLFLNTVNLVDFLLKINQTSRLFIGRKGVQWPSREKGYTWYVSKEEYMFEKFPPFPNGGLVITDMETLQDFHIAANYVKKFRFDDVYLGILAHKVGIQLTSINKYITMTCPRGNTLIDYPTQIATHCAKKPADVKFLWDKWVVPLLEKESTF